MTTDPHMQPLAGSAVADQAPLHQAGKPRLRAAVAKQTRERLILLSMGLVTAAAAATCYVLLEYSLASSVLAGGGVWAALMTVHLQMKKSAEIARLKAELQRLETARGGFSAEGTPLLPMAADAAQTDAGPERKGLSRRGQTPKQGAPTAPVEAGARMPRIPGAPNHEQQQTSSDAGPTSGPASGTSGLTPQPRWEATSAGPRAAGRPASAGTGPRADKDGSRTGGRVSATPPVVETALWPGTSLSAADPMRDQWAFRPREGDEGQQALADDNGDDTSIAPPAPSSSIDADLEMVQRKIKALADEVNAAELTRDRQPGPGGPAHGGASTATTSAIEKSIGALKATAESMRSPAANAVPQPRAQATMPNSATSHAPPLANSASRSPAGQEPTGQSMSLPQGQALPFELLIPDTAQSIAISEPSRAAPSRRGPQPAAPERIEPQLPPLELPDLPVLEFVSPPPPPNPRLAAIIAAVETGEMDVFLSPIVALQSHQVSHYDVTVRLKSANGGYLDSAEQELQLAGSDVLALFDTARLKRAAVLAQRLDAHNKSGSLLSAVNGPSITNAEFLETFARVFEERDRISNQLVLTFSQADLEQFSPSAWQALSDMHAFGFRFALSKIDHVDMDFAALAKRGFAFLRLEASALTHGLPARDRFIEAHELCQLLAGAGMTLVAGTIDDEAVRARVFGFGILFGQGRLFGGARQVKLDPLPRGASAAA